MKESLIWPTRTTTTTIRTDRNMTALTVFRGATATRATRSRAGMATPRGTVTRPGRDTPNNPAMPAGRAMKEITAEATPTATVPERPTAALRAATTTTAGITAAMTATEEPTANRAEDRPTTPTAAARCSPPMTDSPSLLTTGSRSRPTTPMKSPTPTPTRRIMTAMGTKATMSRRKPRSRRLTRPAVTPSR